MPFAPVFELADRSLLLQDGRDVFREMNVPLLKTAVLLAELAKKDGRPWSGISWNNRREMEALARSMSRVLRPIGPVTIRVKTRTAKGYRRRGFEEVSELPSLSGAVKWNPPAIISPMGDCSGRRSASTADRTIIKDP